MNRLLLIVGPLLLIASGCANNNSSSAASPEISQPAAPAPSLRVTPTDMVLKHSTLPIDYLISSPATIRIDDVTANQVLWQQTVQSNTHLRINIQGIKVNNKWVYSKRLKSEDLYRIVLLRQHD